MWALPLPLWLEVGPDLVWAVDLGPPGLGTYALYLFRASVLGEVS